MDVPTVGFTWARTSCISEYSSLSLSSLTTTHLFSTTYTHALCCFKPTNSKYNWNLPSIDSRCFKPKRHRFVNISVVKLQLFWIRAKKKAHVCVSSMLFAKIYLLKLWRYWNCIATYCWRVLGLLNNTSKICIVSIISQYLTEGITW